MPKSRLNPFQDATDAAVQLHVINSTIKANLKAMQSLVDTYSHSGSVDLFDSVGWLLDQAIKQASESVHLSDKICYSYQLNTPQKISDAAAWLDGEIQKEKQRQITRGFVKSLQTDLTGGDQ